MKINDEYLKRLYLAYVALNTPESRKNCPTLDKLDLIFDPHIRRRKKQKLIDHLASCALCAKDFAFLKEIENYQNDFIEHTNQVQQTEFSRGPSFRPPHKGTYYLQLLSAATGLIFVIISVAIMLQKWSGTDILRADNLAVTLIEPIHNWDSSKPLVFKWKGVKRTEYYVLELYDEALLPVWKSSETSVMTIPLPSETLIKLVPNKPYYWMVSAYGNGEKLADSPLVQFVMVSH